MIFSFIYKIIIKINTIINIITINLIMIYFLSFINFYTITMLR